jgi:hypothetical protein
MTKLIAFDLDDTLAPAGKGITQSNLTKLRTLEQRGIQIAVCSGKPTYYLCGFLRQTELKRPILLGENGTVVQIGVDLPPQDFYIQDHSPLAKQSMDLLREKITEALPQMWFQPNLVCLTPFPTTQEEHRIILDILDACAGELHDIDVYHHYDSFDILPKGISKKTGLEWVGQLLHIAPNETIAVGNGENDYPMFDYASVSVGVNVPDPRKVTVNFSTLSDALDFLLEGR